MTPVKLISLLLALQTTLGSHLLAQANDGGEQASIRFRIMALHTLNDSEDFFYRSREGFEPVRISHFRPSEEMTAMLAPDGQISFFTREEASDGETKYSIMGRSSVPSGSRQILVLAAKVNEQLVMTSVADNLSESDQDWLFINASKMPLAVMLGKGVKPFPIRPGQSVFHQPEVPKGTGARIQVVGKKESGWERVYSTYWPIREGQRGLIIFMSVGDDIRVKNIPEAVASLNENYGT
jgi:hypothetical protein